MWFGLKLAEKQEDEEEEDLLHNTLYNPYWDWQELNNKDK